MMYPHHTFPSVAQKPSFPSLPPPHHHHRVVLDGVAPLAHPPPGGVAVPHTIFAPDPSEPTPGKPILFRSSVLPASVSTTVSHEKSSELFLGQLPSSYSAADVAQVLCALGAEAEGHCVQVRQVKLHCKNRNCAFVVVNESALPVLLRFHRWAYCDHNILWLARDENERLCLQTRVQTVVAHAAANDLPRQMIVIEPNTAGGGGRRGGTVGHTPPAMALVKAAPLLQQCATQLAQLLAPAHRVSAFHHAALPPAGSSSQDSDTSTSAVLRSPSLHLMSTPFDGHVPCFVDASSGFEEGFGSGPQPSLPGISSDSQTAKRSESSPGCPSWPVAVGGVHPASECHTTSQPTAGSPVPAISTPETASAFGAHMQDLLHRRSAEARTSSGAEFLLFPLSTLLHHCRRCRLCALETQCNPLERAMTCASCSSVVLPGPMVLGCPQGHGVYCLACA